MHEDSLTSAIEADEEYRIIEHALLETPRGRWFLSEHGRRSRRVDAAVLEDAVHNLQASLRHPPATLSLLRSDVERLRSYVGQERELLHTPTPTTPPQSAPAYSSDQDHLTGMLAAAEDLHAMVWSMRDQVPAPDVCEAVARQASRIYVLSNSQAKQSQRFEHAATALDETYARLSMMLETILAEMQPPSSPPRRPTYLPNGSKALS